MPHKPVPTALEVARRAGVSQSAVSRCFTPGASIAPPTRAKVLKAARELGYQPNLVARSLATRRSHLVAVLLPEVTNRYYPEVLLRLTKALEESGLRVLLMTFPRDAEAHGLLAEVTRYQVDGVLMAGRPQPEVLSSYRRRGVPIVLFNRYWAGTELSAVSCDHRRSAAEAAERLFRSGRRRFALITGPADSPTNAERERGFRDELARLGVAPPPAACGRYDYAASAAALDELLASRPQTDALFCTNDIMAYGALDALRRAGRTPGQDVAVVGFDDMTPSGWDAYSLTTVRQPLERMARQAVELLLRDIEHEREAEHVFLPGRLIPRDSARL